MNKRGKSKAERRNLLVNTAIECFIRNGIHKTGIREIAKEANVSLGNMYNHFSSKHELIAEIATLDKRDLELIIKELNSNEDTYIAISKFIDNYLDYVSVFENAVLTIDIIAESIRNPIVAEQFESNRQNLCDALTITIKKGISENVMRDQISVDDTAKLLLDAIEGLGLRIGLAQIKPSKVERTTLQELILRMISLGP
ncbi:MAG: TetR/AcrR family transcriptional repressor of uid operon [Methylophilaceae bacterium]|jgi:TetR/AcrR family transcriptional repressor of uid operon